jgi:hypothetical protein
MTSKNTRQDVTADKLKYIIMFPEQNAGRSHNIKADSSPFQRVVDFKYIGNKLNISKFYSGSNLGHSEFMECLLSFGAESISSRLLCKYLKMKIHRNIILPVVLYGCETWSLTLREERRLRM